MAETTSPGRRKAAEDREVDYLICNQCATPCYVFDMNGGSIADAQCLVCGNDSPRMFSVGEEAGSEES